MLGRLWSLFSSPSPVATSDQSKSNPSHLSGTVPVASASQSNGNNLDIFLADLDKIEQATNEKIKVWNGLRAWVSEKNLRTQIADENQLRDALDHFQETRQLCTTKNAEESLIMKAVHEFFHRIKDLVGSPHEDLHELLHNDVGSEIEKLCHYLQSLREQLTNTCDDKLRKFQIELNICDVSIEILLDKIRLVKRFREEINNCLQMEEAGEKVAIRLAQLVVLLATKMPLPDPDMHLTASYREYVDSNILTEKADFYQLEEQTDVSLSQAEKQLGKEVKQEAESSRQIGARGLMKINRKAIEEKVRESGTKELQKYNDQRFYAPNKNPRNFGESSQLPRTHSAPSMKR